MMHTIAVDAMGGDYAPRAVVEGVGEALDMIVEPTRLLLVGHEQEVAAELARIGKADHPNVAVVPAEDVVHMHEPPAAAMRSKRKSSINVAVDLMKCGEAQAVVSAGNTGAAVASTVVKLRTLPGIERPGIAAAFPLPAGGDFVLLDVGATVDCKAIHLVHYAVMGDVYARRILGIPEPRVGLLNVGAEQTKGNDLTKLTFKTLEATAGVNFIGNVEGHDLFEGGVDVVVCDGFVGNVVLKTCESLGKLLAGILKDKLQKTVLRKAGYFLSRNAYRELRQLGDAAEYGGCPLLGVNGVCIIGHGSSSARAIRNAIRVAGEFIRHEVNEHIVKRIGELGLESDIA